MRAMRTAVSAQHTFPSTGSPLLLWRLTRRGDVQGEEVVMWGGIQAERLAGRRSGRDSDIVRSDTVVVESEWMRMSGVTEPRALSAWGGRCRIEDVCAARHQCGSLPPVTKKFRCQRRKLPPNVD